MHLFLVFTLSTVMLGCGTTQGWDPSSHFSASQGLGHDPYGQPKVASYKDQTHEDPQFYDMEEDQEGQVFLDDPPFNYSAQVVWPPVMSPQAVTAVAVFSGFYYLLSTFSGSFGRYNVLAKFVQWAMVVVPLAVQLTNFKFANLVLCMLTFFPLKTGLYRRKAQE